MSAFATKETKSESGGSSLFAAPAPGANSFFSQPMGPAYAADSALRPQSGPVSQLMSHWAEPVEKGKGVSPIEKSTSLEGISKGAAGVNQCSPEDSAEATALYGQIVALLQQDDKACIDPARDQSPFQLLRSASASVRKEVLIKLRSSAHLQILLSQCSQEEVTQWTEWIPEATPPAEKLMSFDNPMQAAQARTELCGLQLTDVSARLTDGIIELLVFGVGHRKRAQAAKTRQALDTEGIIGIEQAIRAARALMLMPKEKYLSIVSQLVMAGGTPQQASATADPRIESVLLLKAVAARLDQLTGKAPAAADKAEQDVSKFGDEIRGQDAEQLQSNTSVRDHGNTDGLMQKFTMTCGPTSIQLVHGEADPINALQVSKDSKHDLNYRSGVAKEQASYLNKDVVPRSVEDDYHKFNSAFISIGQADLNKAIALQQWIAGLNANPQLVEEGQVLANRLGFPLGRLLEFKSYYPYLSGGPAPGWTNSEFAQKANAELSSVTGGQFNERAIPLTYQAVAGKMSPVSQLTPADVDALWRQLFRGIDVPMGIMWTGGGGHFMVFTNCQDTGTTAAPVRSFLLSDPASGKSAWISEANLIQGNLSPFGSGAIDSLYL